MEQMLGRKFIYVLYTIYFLYLPHPINWEMSVGVTFQIISLNHVPGMKGLNPVLLELIVLIQDYDGYRKRT